MKVVGCVLLVSLLASFIIMGAGETRPPLVGTAQCPYEYISTDGPNLYASADFSFYQNLTLGPVHALHLATPFVVPNDGVFEVLPKPALLLLSRLLPTANRRKVSNSLAVPVP